MSALHRFVVVRPSQPAAWFDDVRSAFESLRRDDRPMTALAASPGATVFVTYEPTGFRVSVRRP